MLGFLSSGDAELTFPEIGPDEEKILLRYVELYKTHGDILNKLISDAHKKMTFSEESVCFWAPYLVDGSFGPISVLMKCDAEEIMVNGVNLPIYIYDRKKGMLSTNLQITSSKYFSELTNRMLLPLGRRLNSSNPRESGILENGDRISAAIPPYSHDCTLSIRKYSTEPLTILDLVHFGMLSFEAAAFLWTVFEIGNINTGIVGNTGSGKTTLLNALIRFAPQKNRVILVEDIPEINPPQKQIVGLVSNKELEISMRDAILDSLRLRPDRVVIGEVRKDSEVGALKEACLSGHSMGTYFTYHAESSRWAYRRLHNQGFPEYDLQSIPLLVVCKRFEKSGKTFRKVVEIGGKKPVFLSKEGELERVGDFSSEYWKIAFKKPWKEVDKRAEFLRQAQRLKDEELFKIIQGYR